MQCLSILILFTGYACVVSSQALAAWYTNIGPQIVYQNASSGDLLFTMNTGSGSFAGFTPWAKLPMTIQPKRGTALAGSGFTGGDGLTYGQIFYISNTGSIAELAIQCTASTGVCVLQGNYVLSGAVTTGVNNLTALSVCIRSSDDGYRLFYHDNDGRSRMLRYSGPLNITWGDGILVNNNPRGSLTALTTDGGTNLTLYSTNSDGTIIPTALQNNGSWSVMQTPQQLDAWSATNASLAATFSSDSANITTRKLYYIGTDRQLHEFASTNSSQGLTAWSAAPSQTSDIWPLADVPNAQFAAASTGGTLTTMFYFSTGSFIQLVCDDGNWQKASTIFEKMPTNPTTNDSASSKSSNSGVKIGTGVGIGVGVPLLAAIVLGACLSSRRRNKTDLNAIHVQSIHEKQGQPIAELGNQEYSRPIAEMGHPEYELP